MNKPFAIAVLLSLSFAACGKEEPKPPEPAKNAEQAKLVQPVNVDPPPKKTEPSTTPTENPEPPAATMDNVHAYLKANKKMKAIREYRNLHGGKLALNAASFGVELERQKLGIPSALDVYKLYFEGKEEEALKALAAKYNQPAESQGIQRLWVGVLETGPATEDNLNAKAAAGESTAALRLYHHLHPDTPIPEAWKAVELLMAKTK